MLKFSKLACVAAIGGTIFASGVKAETVNLTWQMWAGNAEETAVWEHLAGMVSKTYPDIKVTVQTIGWTDYWTKLPIQAASGQLADIVAMQSLRMPNFYALLEPLDGRIEADKFNLGAFNTSILEGMSANGDVYGLPYDVGPWVVFYNKDAFEVAGVPLPKPGWTNDEFVEAAKKLTRDGNYGAGFYPANYAMLATAWGTKYLDDAGALDLTNAGAVKAADTFIGYVAKDKIAPQVASGMEPYSLIEGRFNSGNVAMYLDGPWAMINKKGQVKFKLGMTTMPRSEKELTAPIAGSGFGISAASANKDAAWKAIQIITGPEALAYLAEQGRALPARTAEQPLWYKVAAADVTGAAEALAYSLSHSAAYPITANFTTVENLFNQYFPPAFNEGTSGQETMQTIQSLAQ